MAQIVILGQGQSVLRFLNQKEFENNKKSVFFSISSFVFIVIAVFILFCQSSTHFLSNLLDESGLYYNSLKISIYIIAVTVLNNPFQNKLRADEKSIFYTILNLIKLIVMMVLTIYFIVQLKFGIDGVLYGRLISEAVALMYNYTFYD